MVAFRPIRPVFLIFVFLTGSRGVRWGSGPSLPDGGTVAACGGATLLLPWSFSPGGTGGVLDVEWYRTDPVSNAEDILGSCVSGFFLLSSHADPRVAMMDKGDYPNPLPPEETGAGLKLTNVTVADSGWYKVKVNVNQRGSIVQETQSIFVNVTDATCNVTSGLDSNSTQDVYQRLAALERENQRLRDILAANPQLQDAYKRPRSCQNVKAYNSASGRHTLYMADRVTVPVYCEQTTDSGGWEVVQRRLDGSVDFERGWFQYVDGFGNEEGEFWIGLERLHALTSRGWCRLRVDLEDWGGERAYAVYDTFHVSDWRHGYRLNVSGYHGTAGDALGANSGHQFSTADRDHDSSSDNCARTDAAGWWFGLCTWTNPNGRYKTGGAEGLDGITWYFWRNDYRSLKKIEMKLRSV